MRLTAADDFMRSMGMALARARGNGFDRPFITLTYAQSLDGSIAARPMRPLPISGRESLRMTHFLRACHQGIMVGIRTVLSDDPSLTVRLVSGSQPQPVVLDSGLRLPIDCKLMRGSGKKPWVAATKKSDPGAIEAYEKLGAKVLVMPSDENGRVDLIPLLERIYNMGVTSLMVEGGSRVLTSFLRAGLADQVVVTIAPRFVGGLRAIGILSEDPELLPGMEDACCAPFGQDIVVRGRPVWHAA